TACRLHSSHNTPQPPDQDMTRKVPFGRRMRDAHFAFAPEYTPLNHGSFGAFPGLVQDRQTELQKLAAERPDTFIVTDLPNLIDESREAVAPLLGIPVDEVVFVPNATTGINTVLRNLKWEEGDVIVHFSTIYGACEKTIASIGEMGPLIPRCVLLEYPVEDNEIIRRFKEMVGTVRREGGNVRMAMFDTVLTFPGARMPWEELVKACKELGVFSLIDGAHGIGHIDLTHLGSVGPDFFVSNCHKWLYTPRGCAVFHVPARNQHLIRTCLPTSHGYYLPSQTPDPKEKSPFVHLFEFVATIDYTPYACVPAAISFRKQFCGGEDEIRKYCWEIARDGGKRVAEILETSTMGNETETLTKCCFSNIQLPLVFKRDGNQRQPGEFSVDDAPKIQKWLNATAVKEFDTYLQIAFHAGIVWVRLSGQIYLELKDFEWVGYRLKDLCGRLSSGETTL
ncbi:Hercynylcysteine sulfoxide lyase, partial [Lachnellula suecica]